jgi:hypothetical protein
VIALIADLDKTVPFALVLRELDTLAEEAEDDSCLHDGSWNGDLGRYEDSTPEQVRAYFRDRISETREALLAGVTW